MYKKRHFNVVLNLVLKPFGLEWGERLGLSYRFYLNYSYILFNLTKDKAKVLEFLGVDPDKYDNSTFSMSNFLEFLDECKYTYLPSIFGHEELPTEDLNKFKEELVKHIRFSIEYSHLPYVHNFENKFHPYKDTNRFLHRLDKVFDKKGSLIRSSAGIRCYKDRQSKAFIINKFNGKLMVDWVPDLLHSTNFGNIKKAFQRYVEKETRGVFNAYVKKTPGKIIRRDFSDWYFKVYKQLDKEFNDLPL
jgi:hypothetical protein